MITYTIISLFPDLIDHYSNTSIIQKAQNKGLVKVNCVDLRTYASGIHRQVDDYQYGGSGGMVLMIQPLVDCLVDLDYQNKQVWLMSPRGVVWNQTLAVEWSKNNTQDIIIICGHYEGVDERINEFITHYYSIGDYVLTSGILPSLVIIDSIIRVIDGVINDSSLISESFNDYLLDHPVYTKPQVFDNNHVPDVLLSGNHKAIDDYRLSERIRLTKKYRPDLYQKYLDNKSDT